MLKPLWAVIFFSLSFSLFARECAVYGISDSPQSLECAFGSKKLSLRCSDGVYYVGSSRVVTSYHFDVVRGPIPLVFKTASSKLIVHMWPKGDLKAEFFSKGQHHRGSCL